MGIIDLIDSRLLQNYPAGLAANPEPKNEG
jgi:hypothetical protein